MENNENKTTENATPKVNDQRELDQMELEAFRQYWLSLNAALAEIKELRGGEKTEIDPVIYVKKEVETLKNQFAEIKEMISSLRSQPQQQQQPVQRFQPSVPILPYYSTPNFAPMLPINQ